MAILIFFWHPQVNLSTAPLFLWQTPLIIYIPRYQSEIKIFKECTSRKSQYLCASKEKRNILGNFSNEAALKTMQNKEFSPPKTYLHFIIWGTSMRQGWEPLVYCNVFSISSYCVYIRWKDNLLFHTIVHGTPMEKC